MADSLERRVETAVEALIAAALPSMQTIKFGEVEKATADYVAVRVTRAAEDPPGTGIFMLDVMVLGHGSLTPADIDAIDTLFSNAYELADDLRTEGATSFVMPGGLAVELGTGSKAGAKLDTETSWSFGVWAQTQQISDAA